MRAPMACCVDRAGRLRGVAPLVAMVETAEPGEAIVARRAARRGSIGVPENRHTIGTQAC